MNTPPDPTFRSRVVERMTAALGQPQVLPVVGGEIYRWTLARPYDLDFFVTIDSPEHPYIAHVMLSDGLYFQKKPVESFVLERMEDVDALVKRIVAQWQQRRRR